MNKKMIITLVALVVSVVGVQNWVSSRRELAHPKDLVVADPPEGVRKVGSVSADFKCDAAFVAVDYVTAIFGTDDIFREQLKGQLLNPGGVLVGPEDVAEIISGHREQIALLRESEATLRKQSYDIVDGLVRDGGLKPVRTLPTPGPKTRVDLSSHGRCQFDRLFVSHMRSNPIRQCVEIYEACLNPSDYPQLNNGLLDLRSMVEAVVCSVRSTILERESQQKRRQLNNGG